MRTVLVTGATGLIGRQVLQRLSGERYEVHAVTSQQCISSELLGQAHTWHRANLLDHKSTDAVIGSLQPDILLHLAWSVPAGGYEGEEHHAWEEASERLILRALRKGGVRIVVAGSCFEYDWQDGVCREDATAVVPMTAYGRSKNALRVFLESACRATHSSWAWGRIFFVFGPYENSFRFVPAVVNGLLEKRPVALSHGRQVRDFLYSGDVASALIQLLESGYSGVCNIGSGRGLSLKALAGAVADRIGSPDLLQFGAREALAHEAPLVVADVERLEKEVGWQPPASLEDGLALTIQWWRTELDRRRRG